MVDPVEPGLKPTWVTANVRSKQLKDFLLGEIVLTTASDSR